MMKKNLNPRPKVIPRSASTRRIVRRVGVVPRALKYFLLLSVALHTSLIFVGRQMSVSAPIPKTSGAGSSPMLIGPKTRPSSRATHASRKTRPFRLNLAGLKTYRSHVRGYTMKLVRKVKTSGKHATKVAAR